MSTNVPLNIDLSKSHTSSGFDLTSEDGVRNYCAAKIPSLRQACVEAMELADDVCDDGLPAVPLAREKSVEDVFSFATHIFAGVTTKGKRIPVFSDHAERGTKLRNGKTELTCTEKEFGLSPTLLENASPHARTAVFRHWCGPNLERLGNPDNDTNVNKIGSRNWLTTRGLGSLKRESKGYSAFIGLVSIFFESRSDQEVRKLADIPRLAEACVHTIASAEIHVSNPNMSSWSATKDLRFANYTPARSVTLWMKFLDCCLLTPALHTIHIRSPTNPTTYEDDVVILEHAEKSLTKFRDWQKITNPFETLLLSAIDKIRGSNIPLVGTVFGIFREFICRFVIFKHDWDMKAILMLESLVNEKTKTPCSFFRSLRGNYMHELHADDLRALRERNKLDLPAIGDDFLPSDYDNVAGTPGANSPADPPKAPRKNARNNQRPATESKCLPISSKDDAKHAGWWKLYSKTKLHKLLPSSLKNTCNNCGKLPNCVYCFTVSLIADLHSLAHCAAPIRPVSKNGGKGSGAVLVGGAILTIPLHNKIFSKKKWSNQVCLC